MSDRMPAPVEFKIMFVRHGKKQGAPVPNNAALLTEEGVAQVRATGKCLPKIRPAMVLASNLPRAIQTAELLVEEMGYGGKEVAPCAGLSYVWGLETAPLAEVGKGGAMDRFSSLGHGESTVAAMAEAMPNYARQTHGQFFGTLSVILGTLAEMITEAPTAFDECDDGSYLVVVGNHDPVFCFAPRPEDWSKVTKRGEASGLTIRARVEGNAFEILPGVELFDAGPVEN